MVLLAADQLSRLRRNCVGLRRWFRQQARELPWRGVSDPYAVWVSEVMLQQTQIATVIPYYQRWMSRFPSLRALAAAEQNDVLILWEGLGYYSRARNFHAAARRVVAEHQAKVPRDRLGFRALPGVGEYTAAAVLSIAFDANLATVDGNVKRVFSRLLALEQPVEQPRVSRALWRLGAALLPRRGAGTHNQALMELGQRICTPRAPRCGECPLASSCRARAIGDPARFPPRATKRKTPHRHLAVAVVRRRGRLLLYRRPQGGMLAGLWDLPAEPVDSDQLGDGPALLSRCLAQRYGLRVAFEHELPLVRHAYTHFKVTLHPCLFSTAATARSRVAEGDGPRWVAPEALGTHPMPRASQKVLESLKPEA